ncbi:MAG: hypothetical protein ACRD9R_00560 [Pyrinomonadaceae bacterium]
MKNRMNMLATISVIVIALFIGVAVTSYSQTEKPTEHSVNKIKEVPTVVQDGMLTEQQREHAKLYDDRGGLGKTIKELVRQRVEAKSKEEVSIITLPGHAILSPDSQDEKDPVQEFVTRADAVVIGTVKGKVSHITGKGTYIFTDYTLSLEDVFKNDSSGRLTVGDNIVVTRPGGSVLLDGITATTFDSEYNLLEVGKKYLLFLSRVPATGGYQSLNDSSSFLVAGDKAVSINETVNAELPGERSLGAFVVEVYSALATKPGGNR